MKQTMLALMLVLSVRYATAQERVADEEARKIAKVLIEAGAKLKGPLTVEADADKPYAKRKDDHGAMLVPAKALTTDTIEKASKDIAPVGLLFMRNLSIVADDKLLPAASFKSVSFTHNDQEVTVMMAYVGVKKEKDQPALVVLGNDRKPLVTLPLEKADEKLVSPLEFLVTIEGNRASIVVQVLGKFKTRLKVGPATE